MKVLVTGSGGYIGPAVLDHLNTAGVSVQTCDIGWFDSARVGQTGWPAPDHHDFTQVSSATLAGVDGVIHLAGYSNDPLGWLHPDETLRLNYHETVRLAQRARDAGVSVFVFASSCSVFGDSGDVVACEAHEARPLTPYAQSKAQAERALLDLQRPGFRVASVRGATAFGSSPVPRTDLLLNELCAEAALGRSARLTSTGESWRPFMPIADFARALVVAALHAPQHDHRPPIWNIAPPSMQMTVRDAANLTAAIANLPPVQSVAGATPDKRSYRVDGSKFVQDFPMFSYSSGLEHHLAQCIASFSAIPSLHSDLASRRFIRLETLLKSSQAAE